MVTGSSGDGLSNRRVHWGEGPRPTERIYDYGIGPVAVKSKILSKIRRGLGVDGAKYQAAEPNFDNSDLSYVNEDNGNNGLGVWVGVFFRVLCNLLGVILFLRLGWIVAYAGMFLSITTIILCSSLTMVTALSLSAICTNGKVAGGGVYYFISRALGPEFGASIGVLFYVANSVNISLYLLGFGETLVNQLDGSIILEGWDLRIFALFALIGCQIICLVGVSVVVRVELMMLFVALIAIVVFVVGILRGPSSAEWIGQVPLFSSLVDNWSPAFSGSSLGQPSDLSYLNITNLTDVSQCAESPQQKLFAQFGNVNLAVILAVFFPAVTGIMAGANISGNLANPSRDIPKGTIGAIVVAALLYIFLIILIGSSFYRATVIGGTATNDTVPGVEPTLYKYDCSYGGLFFDSSIIARGSVLASFVYFGIYAACLSSGLASLVGAPRILQALARDHVFAFLDPFAKGFGVNDEPLAAYGFTFLLAALCILTGEINSVAPLITTCFLCSYSLVNYACFSAEESASPGWRPTFRFFSKWLAFWGALGCVLMMLSLSAITGFITFTIGLALYKYVEVASREGSGTNSWGPHKESAEYSTALNSALVLEQQGSWNPNGVSISSNPLGYDGSSGKAGYNMKSSQPGRLSEAEIELSKMNRHALSRRLSKTSIDLDDSRSQHSGLDHGWDSTHVKNYRPQCLVLSGPPYRRPALALLVAGLKKAHGVTVFGDVLVGKFSDRELLRLRNKRAAVSYVQTYGINAFNDVIIAPSFRAGSRSLMQISGMGRRMRVNTVVMGFVDYWLERESKEGKGCKSVDPYSPAPTIEDFVGVIGDAFDLGLGVVILRGEMNLLRSEYVSDTVYHEMERVLALGLGQRRNGNSSTTYVGSADGGAYENPNYISQPPPQLHSIYGDDEDDQCDTSNGPDVEDDVGVELDSVNFQDEDDFSRKSSKRIDVWWLVDDGGLALILPHILRQAMSPPWVGCALRVMAIGEDSEDVRSQGANMVELLSKLRIFAKVEVVTTDSVAKKKVSENESDLPPSNGIQVTGTSEPRAENRSDEQSPDPMGPQILQRRNTYESVGKLILTHSNDALLVVVSLPVPPASVHPKEYMIWLDLLSRECEPPVLMVRGNQRDVVTIFS